MERLGLIDFDLEMNRVKGVLVGDSPPQSVNDKTYILYQINAESLYQVKVNKIIKYNKRNRKMRYVII